MNLLLIEDDIKTAKYIQAELEKHQHIVDVAMEGLQGERLACKQKYDALIVDRMLPDIDGISVLERLRQNHIKTPALILSAMDGINHRVEGLHAGADDYLVKPFAFEELHARLYALVRRSPSQEPTTIFRVGGLELDLTTRRASFAEKAIELQPTEARLLQYMISKLGQIVTRTMLLEDVWDFNFDPKTSIVETHISRLRTKLESICPHTVIHTVRGSGYIIHDTTDI